jgi:imidazolonepropionase-like amidohydrolase
VHHGDNAGELLQLVRIGLTPMQAIEVATRNSAAAIGLAGEIGSIEGGKRADLIATDRNPLDNIEALRHVTFAMRDGHVLKHQ